MENIDISFDPTGIDEKIIREYINKFKQNHPELNIEIEKDRHANFNGASLITLVSQISVQDLATLITMISGLINIYKFLEDKRVKIDIPNKDIFRNNLTWSNVKELLQQLIYNPQKPA